MIVSDETGPNITPLLVTSLPASAIAGRAVSRNTSGRCRATARRRRGDDALISSGASKAGQPVAIMSARSPVRGKIGAVHCAPRGPKVLWRPGSASHRVRPDDLISRRRLVARIAEALQHAVVRTIAVRRQACFELGQRSRKFRAASSIWRSTIELRTAPRAGSLARAERPSGVAAKDASACNSLASNRSTIALMA